MVVEATATVVLLIPNARIDETTRTNTPISPPPLPPIALAADLIKPVPPPAPKLTNQNFFPPEEFPLLLQELMEIGKTGFVPKNETIFQTDFSRLKTNLIDKKNQFCRGNTSS